jgi:hypothetical protein
MVVLAPPNPVASIDVPKNRRPDSGSTSCIEELRRVLARASQSSWREEEEGSPMKNAKELLEEFTAASFRDPKKAAEMFAEDGAFEMPYLESLGVPGRYEGREAIEGLFRFVRDVYPDMDLENIKLMIDTPEQVFAEYEFTAQSSKTGRTIHELFFGRLVAEKGKIKLLRESVNLVEVALGVFPNGLADYKVPSEHKA